jgi:hypothetical protein
MNAIHVATSTSAEKNVEIVCIAFRGTWFHVMPGQLICGESRPSMILKEITAMVQVGAENHASLPGETFTDHQCCRLKAKMNDIVRGMSQSDVCFRATCSTVTGA